MSEIIFALPLIGGDRAEGFSQSESLFEFGDERAVCWVTEHGDCELSTVVKCDAIT